MIDRYGREIDHLRLLLTDYCNLACQYCVTEGARTASPCQFLWKFARVILPFLSRRTRFSSRPGPGQGGPGT
jgi:molybdenum cofactor biosynthesis enzyme MoaA